MSDTKSRQLKDGSCSSCGDDKVALTEERDSPPRCAGCGKEMPKPRK